MKRGIWGGVGLLLLGGVLAWWSAGSGPAAAQDKKEPPSDKEARDQLLEAVGVLSAAQLYQGYLNIGFVADGKAEGTYEEKDAKQILGAVLSLLDTLDKQLEKVGKLDLDKADREGVDQIRKLSGQLRDQGKELQAFWATGSKERAAAYEKIRKESWAGISKLLGFDK
jgi:glutamine synthetase type III